MKRKAAVVAPTTALLSLLGFALWASRTIAKTWEDFG